MKQHHLHHQQPLGFLDLKPVKLFVKTVASRPKSETQTQEKAWKTGWSVVRMVAVASILCFLLCHFSMFRIFEEWAVAALVFDRAREPEISS